MKSKYHIIFKQNKIKIINEKLEVIDLNDNLNPLIGEWPLFGKDYQNIAYGNDSDINKNNVDRLKLKYTTPIGETPTMSTDTFASMTFDQNNIYLTTNGQYNENNQLTDRSGYLFSIKRQDGSINWRRYFPSYSGIKGDYSRAAPAIWNDRLFLASNIQLPQTFAPYNNVVARFTLPPIPVNPTNRRIRMYSINKNTGDLIWEAEVGNKANLITDMDNWLTITASPTVFEINNIPIVAVTTSSSQSFAPWLYVPEGNPLGLSFGTRRDFQMTDIGALYMFNGINGQILSKTSFGPTPYKQGDILDITSIAPTRKYFKIIHYVEPEDLIKGGGLNPVKKEFTGFQEIVWTLYQGSIIPTPLNGIIVIDTQGNPITLKGGSIVTTNLNQVVVSVRTEFNRGSSFFNVNGTQYDLNDPNIYLIDSNPNIFNPAVIFKYLRTGYILSKQDAYQASYFGVSSFGSSPNINFDDDGKPVELYLATGQNHSIPYDEMEYIITSTGNQDYIGLMNEIKLAQVNFELKRTKYNLDIIRQKTQNLLYVVTQQANVPLSVRGSYNLKNSIIGIDLRNNNFSNIIWTFQTSGYDLWHQGYVIDARRVIPSTGALVNGLSNISLYYRFPRAPDGDFGESPYLFKGEASIYSKSTIICNCKSCSTKNNHSKDQCTKSKKIKHDKGNDLLVGCNKFGNVYTLLLSDVNVNKSAYKILHTARLGNGGLLGGSNFGSTSDGKLLFTDQRNSVNLNEDNPPLPSPQQFPPNLDWYPLSQNNPDTIMPFKSYNSYISAYDFRSGVVSWEALMIPTYPQSNTPSDSTLSCVSGVVFAHCGDSILRGYDSNNGSIIFEAKLDVAGTARPVINKDEIYIASGRAGYNAVRFNSKYGPTRYLYSFKLAQ